MHQNYLAVAIILSLALVIMMCATPEPPVSAERFRPLFHFTPPQNWTNDPNGLVFYEGEYHLFYQHNPFGNTWGHMSWGHAVSTDLLYWQHLPIAIREYPDPITGDSTMIFSGTVVVDRNTSGLCTGPDCLVAIFTSHVHKNGEGRMQHQSLAHSQDRGRTWKLYDKNPILDIGRKDFRDPKVFWHAATGKWIMLLVIPDLFKVQFYGSPNLREWKLLSEFGNVGDTSRIWECPDLFELPVTGQPEQSRWVLSLSGSHPAGADFVGMQYFIGDFDGTKFTSSQTDPLYVDHGKDFYAGIVFNNVPDRTIMLGWVNNWAYANQIPTGSWRGAMSLPRLLSLAETPLGFRLQQQFVPLPDSLKVPVGSDEIHSGSFGLSAQLEDGGRLEIFKTAKSSTVIGYDNGVLFVDRTQSGKVDFHPLFASREEVVIAGSPYVITLQVVIDQSIVEVLTADGLYAITEQVFPDANGQVIANAKARISNTWVWRSR
jgi:fructan beta-fructosidase